MNALRQSRTLHAPRPRTSPILQTLMAPMLSLWFNVYLNPKTYVHGPGQSFQDLKAARGSIADDMQPIPANQRNSLLAVISNRAGTSTRDTRPYLTWQAKRKALSRGLFGIAGNATLCCYGTTGRLTAGCRPSGRARSRRCRARSYTPRWWG